MSDRLPPLTALRAFDAAARHMSFQRTAAELNVTPAALSFQIKSLEDHFGGPLFIRLNRAVELTAAGRTLAPGAAEGFATLTDAWNATRRLQDNTTLTVTAGPGLTAKWLAPRLYEFARSHPDIDLRFSASLRMVDLKREDVDVAIRFGEHDPEDLYSRAAPNDWLTPVMTPELAAQYPTPESITKAPLIIDESLNFLSQPPCWHHWFKAVGIDFSPQNGTRFSGTDHVVDAAVTGMGVALARRPIIIKDLQDGRLVAPFPVGVEVPACFRFLCLKSTQDQPRIVAFRNWMFDEIEKTSPLFDGFRIIALKDLIENE